MCGIAAILGEAGPAGLSPALERMRRRGPDGRGEWSCPTGLARLGHTRLAIVDLSAAGAQPMLNEDGTVAVTFNGEIYNAPTLRAELERAGHRFRSHADTEVLVHGYEAWGERELLSRLQGMYAFVLWDGPNRRAVLATDHAGMKPLVFAAEERRLYAASDADALRDLLPGPRSLDPEGLCHVLTLGYCPAPATVWRGVSKLRPGHGAVWHDGALTHFRHWSPPGDLGADAPFEAVWDPVVREHLLSDVPIGVLLSAGLDSSAVALAVRRAGARPTCTTLALPGAADESGPAAETAAKLGLPHRRTPVDAADAGAMLHEAAAAFDEPQAYGALLTMVRAAAAARQGGKVILTGDGGDEALAGYTWHSPATPARAAGPGPDVSSPLAPPLARQAALDALAARSFVHGHLQRVFPRFHPVEAAAIFAPLSPRYDESTYSAWLEPEDRPALPSPRREQRLDLIGFCAGSILPKVDRATMGVGLEARCPFLDRRVLDWALARPVEAEPRSKPVLRRYLTGHVPAEVLTRDKQGFSLRLGRPDAFTSMEPWLAESRLVRSGLLNEGWRGFVGPGVPSRDARMFALCMLAAWAEARL